MKVRVGVDEGVSEWVGSRVPKSISDFAIKTDVRLYTKTLGGLSFLRLGPKV